MFQTFHNQTKQSSSIILKKKQMYRHISICSCLKCFGTVNLRKESDIIQVRKNFKKASSEQLWKMTSSVDVMVRKGLLHATHSTVRKNIHKWELCWTIVNYSRSGCPCKFILRCKKICENPKATSQTLQALVD